MTKSRRDELRRLREAATPGRWYVSNDSESGAVCHVDADHIPCAHIDCLESRDDAELVVAASLGIEHERRLDDIDAIACDISNALAAKPNGGG